MPPRSWKFFNLRRLARDRTSSPGLPGCAPPYTLTYTGDELNSDFQAEAIDWKGGDYETAGEDSGLNLLSDLSANDSRGYSDDISSIQSKTQDFEHLGEQQEEIHLEPTEIHARNISSCENAVNVIAKSLRERIGTIIARYSNNKYSSGDFIRHSQSSSINCSTSSSKLLLRKQLETCNSSSSDQTSPKKSFATSIAWRRKRDFLNNQNHQLLHSDYLQEFFNQDSSDSMDTQMQLSSRKKQDVVELISFSSKKLTRSGKKRAVASLDDDECALEMQSQSASNPASTREQTLTNTRMSGFTVNKFKKLPLWRVECILYNRRQARQGNSDLFGGDREAFEADTHNDLLDDKCSIFSSTIQEQDWWKTVLEDNNDTAAREKSPTAIGNIQDVRENLPLCALEPMCKCDSPAFSARFAARPKRYGNRETDDITNRKKVFYNVGLSIWDQSRAEWKSYKRNADTALCPSPSGDSSTTAASTTPQSYNGAEFSGNQNVELHSSPGSTSCRLNNCERALTHAQYKELVQGITNVTREYQLPKPMNLADLIEVYVDVWDCGHES
eukprot:CCRYP_003724-RA/>CCRYP_003724-RA protein AED:0.30 eAED:0.30 QI:0/-1/0/1/-1/1/1/0/556